MKQCTAVMLSILMLFLTACTAAEETGATSAAEQETVSIADSSADTIEDSSAVQPVQFRLESLPEIGSFASKGLQKRWHDTFQCTLTPRNDYGQLIPFIGDVYHFSETSNVSDPYFFHVLNYRYGLMTEDGTIVVDAVFPYLEYYEKGTNGIYSVRAFASDDIRSFDYTSLNTGGYVIAGDGAWCIPVPDGKDAFIFDSVIVIGASPEDGYLWKSDQEIYDLQGQYLFTVRNDDVDWENDMAFVTEYKGVIVRVIEKYLDGSSDGYEYSFYDKTGKQIVPDWAEQITVDELYENDKPTEWQPTNEPPESDEYIYTENAVKPYAVYYRYSKAIQRDLYSLWDTRTRSFRFTDYDYIRALRIGEKLWLLTVRNGICSVLDADLHTVYHAVAGQ